MKEKPEEEISRKKVEQVEKLEGKEEQGEDAIAHVEKEPGEKPAEEKEFSYIKEAESELTLEADLASMKLELEEKTKMLEEKTRIANEYYAQLQYIKADLENLKKFAAKEKVEYIKFASEELLKKLLPVLDSFEIGLKAARSVKESEGAQPISEGMERIYHQLYEILEKEGLQPISLAGAKFDPFKHEAVTQSENSNAGENTILEEYQKGYTFNSKVIRTSKVKVSKR